MGNGEGIYVGTGECEGRSQDVWIVERMCGAGGMSLECESVWDLESQVWSMVEVRRVCGYFRSQRDLWGLGRGWR